MQGKKLKELYEILDLNYIKQISNDQLILEYIKTNSDHFCIDGAV